MFFAFGPLGIFLFVLVVLLLAKATGGRMSGVVAIVFGFIACCFAAIFLYLLAARTAVPVEVVPVVAEPAIAASADVTPTAVALQAEADSGSFIPVEATLAEEKAANPPRPAWVDESKKLVGDDYFVTVMVGPHASREVCDEAMTEELRRATDRYVDQLIGSQGAGELVQLPLADIRRQVVQDEYQEIVQASFGPMVNLYAQLKFDRAMQDRIVVEHEQALVQRRVGVAAGGMSLVILVLGTLFGYLKLDTATRGYYSGRLKLAAAAVILSAVALGALVAHRSGADAVLIGERGLAAMESRL